MYVDVASKEQQQMAEGCGQDEEELEDTMMDMEEQEELQAADTEQLQPEDVKSRITATSGESCKGTHCSDVQQAVLCHPSLPVS